MAGPRIPRKIVLSLPMWPSVEEISRWRWMVVRPEISTFADLSLGTYWPLLGRKILGNTTECGENEHWGTSPLQMPTGPQKLDIEMHRVKNLNVQTIINTRYLTSLRPQTISSSYCMVSGSPGDGPSRPVMYCPNLCWC